MRAVIQRVNDSSVSIDNIIVGEIGRGINILLAISDEDNEKSIDWMIEKIIGLRIFPDDEYKMNLSLSDIGGDIIVISQFTLYGDCRKGKRPSYTASAKPEYAKKLYDRFVEKLRDKYKLGKIATGEFAKMMQVKIINDGPVTLIIDSP